MADAAIDTTHVARRSRRRDRPGADRRGRQRRELDHRRAGRQRHRGDRRSCPRCKVVLAQLEVPLATIADAFRLARRSGRHHGAEPRAGTARSTATCWRCATSWCPTSTRSNCWVASTRCWRSAPLQSSRHSAHEARRSPHRATAPTATVAPFAVDADRHHRRRRHVLRRAVRTAGRRRRPARRAALRLGGSSDQHHPRRRRAVDPHGRRGAGPTGRQGLSGAG